MELPKPVLVLLGAADSVRRMPARAIELPMLALSVGLVWRERFEKQYADLAERGEQVVGGLLGQRNPAVPTPQNLVADENVVVLDAIAHVTDPIDAPHPHGPEPVSGYSTMTIGALRARLRTLSTRDLEALLAYEQTGRARPPFLGLLENRLAKLAAE